MNLYANSLLPAYEGKITPTGAGNTKSFADTKAAIGDHPHMRGKYSKLCVRNRFDLGLPPHAWGIQDIPIYIALVVGITPTCVGNTLQVPSSRHRSEDYPHMRGEYCRTLLN